MLRPLWLHISVLIIVVAVALVLPHLYPFQISALMAVDSSQVLLVLNGTLLALVVGFSSFYFAIMDSRKQDMRRQVEDKIESHVGNKIDDEILSGEWTW